MKNRLRARGRLRRRLALRLALLALPILFWSIAFMTIAGVWPVRKVVGAVSETAWAVVALALPLAAVVLGASVVRQEAREGESARGL